MKKFYRISFVAFVSLMGFNLWTILGQGPATNNNGIIAVSDWEHGIAICEKDYSSVLHLDDISVYNDGFATYVINVGHYDDESHKELKILSKLYCN